MARPTTLGIVWVLAALVVGGLGWFWFALTEESGSRRAGLLLLVAAIVGAGAAVAVLTRGAPAQALSLLASVVFVLGGLAAAVVAAVNGDEFGTDVLLLGGVPIVAGVITALLARNADGRQRFGGVGE